MYLKAEMLTGKINAVVLNWKHGPFFTLIDT